MSGLSQSQSWPFILGVAKVSFAGSAGEPREMALAGQTQPGALKCSLGPLYQAPGMGLACFGTFTYD